VRRPRYLSLTLLLALSLTQPAAAAVPGRGAPPAVSVSAGPGRPAGIGPEDNPVGVPIETLSADPSGAIRVDNVPVPHTDVAGNLNYAIISRANRSVIASGGAQKGQAGITQLLALESAYSDADLMVVSGTAGIDNPALPDFKKLTSLLGATDLTTGMSDALTTQSAPFSVLGIPGGASGTAWLNVGLVPADLPPSPPFVLPPKGDIDAMLQWNILTDQYDVTDEQFPQFDTDGMRDGTATNVMTFNGADYPADIPAQTSGFHVLVVDSVTLRVLANQTLPTNGGPTPVADLQDAFARQLAADARMDGFQQFYANKQPPLVLMQSYGSPAGGGQAWQNAAETVDQLGGNKFAFYALDAQHPDYTLIGQVGGQPYAVTAGTIVGQAGPLSGVLTRTKTMAFEPTTTGPPGGVNAQMLELAYQDPQPFPAFAGGEAAAEGYIGSQLHLCPSETGCSIRQAYWSDYRAVTWSTEAQRLGDITYPRDQSKFTEPQFSAVRTQLHKEFLDIQDVKDYFSELASVFYSAQSQAVLNVKDIGDAVLSAVQPPSVESVVSTLTLISRIVALGQIAGPPASALSSGLAAAFLLGAYLVGQSGRSALPARIQVRTDELGTQLAADLGDAAKNLTVIGRLIAGDYGKLTRFQDVRLTAAWKLEPSSEPSKTAITKAARQWFATALVPAGFSFLAIAWNASPNDMTCDFYEHTERFTVHPWRNEPALAQFRTVIGYASGQPVTQWMFFSKEPDLDRQDNGPSEDLARFLFEAPAGVQLNHYAFMSTAVFGKLWHAVDHGFCINNGAGRP
jgi:hypothetical protein